MVRRVSTRPRDFQQKFFQRLVLNSFFAGRGLAWQEKRFDQIALATNDQLRKPFEPPPVRNFWSNVHPPQHEPELLGRNVAPLDALQQMSIQRWRQVLAADLWHESLAVKSARHRGLQSNDFCWIVGGSQALRQITEFIGAELPVSGKFKCMLDHFYLLIRREAVHFFDHFGRCHARKLLLTGRADKFQTGRCSQSQPWSNAAVPSPTSTTFPLCVSTPRPCSSSHLQANSNPMRVCPSIALANTCTV